MIRPTRARKKNRNSFGLSHTFVLNTGFDSFSYVCDICPRLALAQRTESPPTDRYADKVRTVPAQRRVDVNRRGEVCEAFERVPISAISAAFHPRHIRQCPEPVHLQLENVVLVVERGGTEHWSRWREVRKRKSDFSVAVLPR